MRILLTGSSGWLGRHLAPRLRAGAHIVTGLDVAPGPETQVVGSVADRALIERVFGDHGIEAVVHAAALHKPDIARYAAQAFLDVNVSGTQHLLEAAVRAGHDRFVFTSTTSLMISAAIRAGRAGGARAAAWITEELAPLEPRNIYGVTKLAAEHLGRLAHLEHGLNVVVLRTGRFFPEEDDAAHETALDGPNTKANEFLHRRVSVDDVVEAHVAALDKAPQLGFEVFLISAPTAFRREECAELLRDAPAVIARHFPRAAGLYARRGWQLPAFIDRVYVPAKAERLLGHRGRTDFAAVLQALEAGTALPFAHDPTYLSPKEKEEGRRKKEED